MKFKRIFRRDGLTYSLIKKSDVLALYTVTLDAKILHYQFFRITGNELIFNNENIFLKHSILKFQWDILTKKFEK
jgi:hypothetical protein